jgi:ATP-dependent Clp protease ATP-binding subunit ClpC
MLQQHIRNFTDKVIEALNVGSMEMINLHQDMLTPDFVLLGLLAQEDSLIEKILESA